MEANWRKPDGRTIATTRLTRPLGPAREVAVAFELPWPWGGEHFELRDMRPLNYIIGPLGSGKTRLAKRLAETLPDAASLGLGPLDDGGVTGDRAPRPAQRPFWASHPMTSAARSSELSSIISRWPLPVMPRSGSQMNSAPR